MNAMPSWMHDLLPGLPPIVDHPDEIQPTARPTSEEIAENSTVEEKEIQAEPVTDVPNELGVAQDSDSDVEPHVSPDAGDVLPPNADFATMTQAERQTFFRMRDVHLKAFWELDDAGDHEAAMVAHNAAQRLSDDIGYTAWLLPYVRRGNRKEQTNCEYL